MSVAMAIASKEKWVTWLGGDIEGGWKVAQRVQAALNREPYGSG